MSFTESLPTLNAALNGSATVLLTVGYICIRRGKEKAHRASMIGAFVISAIFLFFYVLHKYLVQGVHTPFQGEGFWRGFYYAMLITHIILAIIIVPMILRTITLALKDERERHKAWARWTFPIWYYVSVTGVLVYLFLYQWFQ
ncbi:MAG: DUF420 domain-containing protein [Verrucomicrobiota bacterium]